MSSGMTEVVQKAICQKLLITLPPPPAPLTLSWFVASGTHTFPKAEPGSKFRMYQICIIWKLFQLDNKYYPTVIAKAINPK